MVGRAPAADVARAACESVLADWWKAGKPGAAVAVIRDGEPVYLGGYGEGDLGHRVPISPSTRFGAASIAGSFADEITIEQLMNHTSGIRELWELLTFAGRRRSDLWTHADALAATVAQGDGNFAAAAAGPTATRATSSWSRHSGGSPAARCVRSPTS